MLKKNNTFTFTIFNRSFNLILFKFQNFLVIFFFVKFILFRSKRFCIDFILKIDEK